MALLGKSAEDAGGGCSVPLHQARETFPIQKKKRPLGPVTSAAAPFPSSNAKWPARRFRHGKEVTSYQMDQVFISKRNYSHGGKISPKLFIYFTHLL